MPNAETAATQAYGASSTVSGETVAMPATQVASADDAAATQVFQPAALAASAQAQPAVMPPSIPLDQSPMRTIPMAPSLVTAVAAKRTPARSSALP